MARFALTIVRHGETRYNKEKLLQELEEGYCCRTRSDPSELAHRKVRRVRRQDLCLLIRQGVDEPLSEIGFMQAEAAGRFLSDVRFTHVFSSDLIRAKQTACTIMKNNKPSEEIKISYDARLRERKYGIAEGQPLSELKTMAKKSGEQCPSFTPPGGETLDQVRARAKDFFEFLCQMVMDETSAKDQAAPGAVGRDRVTAVDLSPFINHSNENQAGYQDNSDLTLDANILLVSHGAYMRNWIKYFVEDLHFTFPPELKKSRELSVSPNTGISHFIISLKPGEINNPAIRCICINRHDHLEDLNADTSHYVV